jgi:hypothetical protein
LNKIKDLGFDVLERKTSRSILQDWGITLDQINKDPKLTLEFQQEIITRKFQDELNANILADNQPVFFERTYADLMAYFLISSGKDNEYSGVINDYYKQCITNQQIYSKVFYLKAGHFVPEHDGVRGANVHYSRMADLVMLDLTTQMTPSDKLTVIDTPCLEQRLNIILAHCGLL